MGDDEAAERSSDAGERVTTERSRLGYVIGAAVAGVVALAGLVAAAIRAEWSTDTWVMIGAIGAVVQAAGVLGAIAFAWVELRARPLAEARSRRALLADELGRAVFHDLAPAARAFVAACRTALLLHGLASAQVDPDEPTGWRTVVGGDYSSLRSAAQTANERLSASIDRVRLLRASLGIEDRNDVMLEVDAIGVRHLLPWTIEEESPSEERFEVFVRSFEGRIRSLKDETEALVRSLAPGPR